MADWSRQENASTVLGFPLKPMKPRVVVVWLVACLLWSSTFAFIRLGLQELPPFTFAWLRLAIAVAVLAPIAIAGGHWRSLIGRDVVTVCGTGVLLLGVNYGLVFWGAQFVPSGLVAILLSGTPVLALGFGWFLGSEGVTARKLLALTLGILGVIVIFGAEARASGQAALLGGVAVFGASICVAFAYVWLKTHGHHLSPTAVTALQSLAGLLPLAGLGLAIEGTPAIARWSAPAWVALLYLALVASVLAFWLNYWLLQRMDASAMLMMGVAEVPIAVALGALVFGERMPTGTLLGGACVLVAVIAGLSPVAPRGGHRRPAG
jgi:drug/metabolite transporter (DMT)-like permease